MKEKICVILIGIRYASGQGHLRGCHNDISNIYDYLQNLYKDNDYELEYHILADSESKICGDYDCLWPNRKNIIDTLVSVRDKYKKFIIHYSGHGTSITDWGGDEDDWKDEAICPYDYDHSGLIKDDTLNDIFLQHLGSDCFVRILMDCCRSGTIWDLKYKYDAIQCTENDNCPNINCNVIVLSGCKDSQYSYDVYTAGESQGAFTHCFLKCINSNENVGSLVVKINNELISGGWGGQTSRLTSSLRLTNKDIFFNFKPVEGGENIITINSPDNIVNDDNIDLWDIFNFCSIM